MFENFWHKDVYKRQVYDDLFEQADCWFEMAEVYRNSQKNQACQMKWA